MRSLPEGFEYSEEARANLRARARVASTVLRQRFKQDEKLRDRVDEILEKASTETDP